VLGAGDADPVGEAAADTLARGVLLSGCDASAAGASIAGCGASRMA